MTRNTDLSEIYVVLAKKYKIPVEKIEKICDSQFEFLKKTMAEGKDEQVRLQYLGVFSVPPNRRKNVQEKREKIKIVHKNRKDGSK